MPRGGGSAPTDYNNVLSLLFGAFREFKRLYEKALQALRHVLAAHSRASTRMHVRL